MDIDRVCVEFHLKRMTGHASMMRDASQLGGSKPNKLEGDVYSLFVVVPFAIQASSMWVKVFGNTAVLTGRYLWR